MQDIVWLRHGDHVKVGRGIFGYLYDHEGIVRVSPWGVITIIHYAGPEGEPKNAATAVIRETSPEEFAQGGRIQPIEHATAFAPDEVVRRAQAQLGRANYSLWGENCQHFARWCKTGVAVSPQINVVKVGLACLGIFIGAVGLATLARRAA